MKGAVVREVSRDAESCYPIDDWLNGHQEIARDDATLLTAAAILLGPLIAVFITRWRDNRKERHDRRMDVFKTLMRTRRVPTVGEHVGALNLIEFEFANDPKVMECWKELFEHFGTEHARRDDEAHSDKLAPEVQARREGNFHKRLSDERQRLLAKLLHAMAKALNFKIEQLEIFEEGYIPQGWIDVELQQQAIRQFAVDLYLGNRVLPIGVLDYTQMSGPPKLEHDTETKPINEVLVEKPKSPEKVGRKK